MQQKKSSNEETCLEKEIEKRLRMELWTLLEVLKIPYEKYQQFKLYSDQLVGLAVSSIKHLQWENARLKKRNEELRASCFQQRQLEKFLVQVIHKGVSQ